ncbi:MAG: hypothetical protein JNG84_07045 [Archangium sp.]|nr:hypothetical protein [Archangium sp.]
MQLVSGRCAVHVERPGIGVCVECRNVVCTECTTQFEGINRCASCLAKRRVEAQSRSVESEFSSANVARAAVAAALLYGFTYGAASLLALAGD